MASTLSAATPSLESSDDIALAERLKAGHDGILTELHKLIVGQEEVIELVLLSLFTGGNSLIVGVPGLAKTLLINTISQVLDLKFSRIQFTPDLMPSDITGTDIIQDDPATGRRHLVFNPGPIFANIVLADEINRTPPKTQSALLEAMEEGQVTIDGVATMLPAPFVVCATQNPIEYEGTYPLPEAQLDRFMVKLESEYPAEAQELDLLARVAAGFDARELAASGIVAVTAASEVVEAQRAIRTVHLSDEVREYVYRIVAATRKHPRLTLGASPRAGIALLLAAQAAAAIEGRDFASPDDVKSVAALVLPHRLIVAPEAEIEGARAADLVREILGSVPVPRA